MSQLYKIIHDGFVKLLRTEDGIEVVQATDSVQCLVYNRTSRCLILVSQWREPLQMKTNEAIAGRCDHPNESKRAIMARELTEEAGIAVHERDIELLFKGKALAESSGLLTSRCTFGYVEIDDHQMEQDAQFGVASESERTTRSILPLSQVHTFVPDGAKTMLLLQWFICNRLPALHGQEVTS